MMPAHPQHVPLLAPPSKSFKRMLDRLAAVQVNQTGNAG